MRKQQKSLLVLGIITAFVAAGFLLPELIGAGELEPSAPPGPTMKTLDEIPPTWSQTLPASERFVLVLNDEAVLDKETGLTWAANANLDGTKTWQAAINYCGNLSLGGRKGWRLPTREELASLVDVSQTNPALPIGYDSYFSNVQSGYYWSSTAYEANSDYAGVVSMSNADVYDHPKTSSRYVWPVRGAN